MSLCYIILYNHYKTIFWLQPYWLIELCFPKQMLCLPRDLNRWAEPFPLSLVWPFWGPSSTKSMVSTQRCLLGNLKNECASSGFPSVTDTWPFQDHLVNKTTVLTLKLCLAGEQLKALSPRTPEKSTCRVEASPGSLMNNLSKPILPLKLFYRLQAVSQESWTMNVKSWGLPSTINEWPFQDHLSYNTIILIQSSVSPKTWNFMHRLPPVLLMNALFKTIFPLKLSYWLETLSMKPEWMGRVFPSVTS